MGNKLLNLFKTNINYNKFKKNNKKYENYKKVQKNKKSLFEI